MNDYIKRSDVLRLIDRNRECANACKYQSSKDFYLLAHDHIQNVVNLIPSADVVPKMEYDLALETIKRLCAERATGEWVEEQACSNMSGYEYSMKCSACGKREFQISYIIPMPPYCPHCGAVMRHE